MCHTSFAKGKRLYSSVAAWKLKHLQLAQLHDKVASSLETLVQCGLIFWHQPFSVPSFFESILGVHLPIMLTISNCSVLSLNEL